MLLDPRALGPGPERKADVQGLSHPVLSAPQMLTQYNYPVEWWLLLLLLLLSSFYS